jgi:hypothetical protein
MCACRWVTLQPEAAYKTDRPPAVRVQLDVRFVPFGSSAEIDDDVADDVADTLEKLHFEGPKGGQCIITFSNRCCSVYTVYHYQ